jgi:hypothetical protein
MDVFDPAHLEHSYPLYPTLPKGRDRRAEVLVDGWNEACGFSGDIAQDVN